MAFAPRYSIVPCCPDLGTPTASFQIPGGPVPNGVYVYNGPTLPPDSGIVFQTGYCYTIIDLGPYPTGAPIAPNFSVFELVVDCFDNKCIACEIAIPYTFEVYACCDSETVITLNIPGADLSIDNTVNQYIGAIPFTVNDFTFVPGECYNITSVASSEQSDGPAIDNFVVTGDFCETAVGCPACLATQQYLKFVSCCDDTTIYLRPEANSTYLPGVYEYVGTPTVGLENICYSVTLYDVGIAPVINIGDYGNLFEAPAFIENITFTTLSNTNTDCDNYKLVCPSCDKTCYTLYNCDGIFFNTTVDMSAYVGTFVSISNIDGPIAGTWYVLLNTGNCNDAIEDITVSLTPPVPCDCRCFEIVGNPKSITYIDCNGNLVNLLGVPTKFCSLVYPLVTGQPGQFQVIESGDCVDGECPIICYKLTNCSTGEIIYSTVQSLYQYLSTGQVITLSGYEGCWQVDNLERGEICDCPVNVIVLQVFDSCPDCLPIIAYKLTGCENSSDIKYTYDDLSVYIDKVVKSDCGCYLVELINYEPPTTTTITIVTSFDTCVECLRTYYILEDCNDIDEPIYTYTDLSGYIGQIIKIQGCDTCWTIKETEVPINPGIVTVIDTFELCEECTPPPPCLCTKMTNYSTTSKNYGYTDCNGNQIKLTLQANESSDKICVIKWDSGYPTDNLEIFGDCVAPVKFNWVCPITVPVKKVKPGYSTPSCDIEKYEKITCKSSEIYYKQVMRLRYGISNCCPEDEEKWLIKKELIDLQALVDPDYACTPVTTCCNQPASSCGCGCNQTLKSCNSQ